jgi:hypothetical protein
MMLRFSNVAATVCCYGALFLLLRLGIGDEVRAIGGPQHHNYLVEASTTKNAWLTVPLANPITTRIQPILLG